MNTRRCASHSCDSARRWHGTALLLLTCFAMFGLALQTACITVVDEEATQQLRIARRVDITSGGRMFFDGEELTLDKLAKRLKKGKSSHRAVALFGAEGCSRTTLGSIQRQLIKKGIPNVSIVIPRRAYAEALDDES